jgi:arylsulfatase A-like enzyme
MDYNVGQVLDAVDKLGIRDNTIVIFTSDNGAEFFKPWDGWAGPWRGAYFTALEGGIRVPFMVRWPRKIPAGRVSNEIVHGVDMFATLA